MGRSQESFNKKQVRKNKEKKRKDKEKRKLARKDNKSGSSLDDMIAYVDEEGNTTNVPPDPTKKKEKIKLDDIEVSIPKRDPNEEPDGLRTGRLAMFNDSKGFGFIKDSEYGADIFVHINNFLDDIVEGNRVSFEIEHGPKGTYAVKVKKI